MKREEVTEKQENLLRSLKPYQNYRALLLLDEAQKEPYPLQRQAAGAEKIHTLSSQYKDMMFGSPEDIDEWEALITQIVLSDRIPPKRVLQNSGTEICKDVSEAQDGSILGWVEKIENVENDTEYILHLDADGKIYAPEDSSELFACFLQVKKIEWGDCLDTRNVIDMSYLFWFCSNLEVLDVSGFDTSRVTNMSDMFSECEQLKFLDVSGFDTENVTDMYGMFLNCKQLQSLDVSGFDTSHVTNMARMFSGCEQLTSLDVSGFDTSRVTNMTGMFEWCMCLTSLDTGKFDTSNVQSMAWMFFQCEQLRDLDIRGFDRKGGVDRYQMFAGCDAL